MKDSPAGLIPFNPNLQDTPGWVSLSSKKKDELFEIARENHQFRQMKDLGAFGELMTMYRASQVLEGEQDVRFIDYVRQIYSDKHFRTALRKEKAFAEVAGTIPAAVLKRWSSATSGVLESFEGIAKAALGDIRNAAREMAQLTVSTERDAEKYMVLINDKLLENRKKKGKPVSKTQSLAEKMATNAIIHYIRDAGLKTSAEKRAFLTRVIGWVMEAQAVSGALKAIHRIPIPDGLLIRRGRPRKKRPEGEK